MFTGIIESFGTIEKITHEGSNVHFDLNSPIVSELKVDQSLAHDGVCLTVVKVDPANYRVTAIQETINKTNLSGWDVGKKSKPRAMYACKWQI